MAIRAAMAFYWQVSVPAQQLQAAELLFAQVSARRLATFRLDYSVYSALRPVLFEFECRFYLLLFEFGSRFYLLFLQEYQVTSVLNSALFFARRPVASQRSLLRSFALLRLV